MKKLSLLRYPADICTVEINGYESSPFLYGGNYGLQEYRGGTEPQFWAADSCYTGKKPRKIVKS
jgi:hypothetical protein